MGARGPPRAPALSAILSNSSPARPYSPLSKAKFASCKIGGTSCASVLRMVRRNMRRIRHFPQYGLCLLLPITLCHAGHHLAQYGGQKPKSRYARPCDRWGGDGRVQVCNIAAELRILQRTQIYFVARRLTFFPPG